MKALITSIIFLTSFYSSAFSQKILTGLIKISGQPVKNLTVYTAFATTKTDDLGRYALHMDGCSFCVVGDKISIFTYSDEYGSSEQTCTISNDYTFNFSIVRNPLSVIVTGVVRIAGVNGQSLSNMKVKILDLEYDMEPVTTNDFGEFRIPIRKDIIPNINAIRLQVIDPNKKYRSASIDPQLYPLNSFITILMEPSLAYSIQVSGFINTTVCVNKGDAVEINASGQIRVGASVGNSDPDGRTSGVFGMSLEAYNIVSSYNHAALMYRFAGDSEWKLAGKQCKFIAPRTGCIEFQINDNTQGDNRGHYDVEINVKAL